MKEEEEEKEKEKEKRRRHSQQASPILPPCHLLLLPLFPRSPRSLSRRNDIACCDIAFVAFVACDIAFIVCDIAFITFVACACKP